MTTTLESVPKLVKALPDDAKALWVEEYNRDFAWRCSESHAEKAAWLAVRQSYKQDGDAWSRR